MLGEASNDAATSHLRTQVHDPLGRNASLERAAEGHRQGDVDRAARPVGNLDDAVEIVQRLPDSPIHIAPVEGLCHADGDEHIAHTMLERVLETTRVGDENAQPWQGGCTQRVEHRGGVRKLWNPLRRDECGCFDAR